jgi:hypothetical protein
MMKEGLSQIEATRSAGQGAKASRGCKLVTLYTIVNTPYGDKVILTYNLYVYSSAFSREGGAFYMGRMKSIFAVVAVMVAALALSAGPAMADNDIDIDTDAPAGADQFTVVDNGWDDAVLVSDGWGLDGDESWDWGSDVVWDWDSDVVWDGDNVWSDDPANEFNASSDWQFIV